GLSIVGMLAITAASNRAADQPTVTFEKDVLPLLQTKCLSCHGAGKQKADLDLRSRASLLKGGETGPAVKPGSAKDSLLWEKINADQMPPDKNKLTAAEKALIKTWIDSGAPAGETAAATPPEEIPDRQVTETDRQFWSFRKPVRPEAPAVKQ